jgi:hypothetical protein
MWLLLPLFVLNLYYAWRYAKIDIDPDFALFNMAGQTGAWYGRDFVDCKSPLVHIWFWLLSRICKSVYWVRFLHFTLTGIPGMIYYGLTGNLWGALAFIVLVHSGFLLTFHGNVGDIPAGLILLALTIGNPWIAFGLFVLAVIYEPKLIVALIAWGASGGFWWQSMAYLGGGLILLGLIWYFKHDWFEWLIEANLTIPKRMSENRKMAKKMGDKVFSWMPSFTANVFLYVGTWIAFSIIAKPNLLYWLPALLYLLLMFAGRVIRPNHLIPLIPWVAASGLNPAPVIALVGVDTVSAGFYLGNIWMRFYTGLKDVIKDSRVIGNWIKDKSGDLWVNSMHSEIYIWSGKPPIYGMTEQVEIASVASERRKQMKNRYHKNPPEWVVTDTMSKTTPITFDPGGYHLVAKSIFFEIYRKDKK